MFTIALVKYAAGCMKCSSIKSVSYTHLYGQCAEGETHRTYFGGELADEEQIGTLIHTFAPFP